MELGPSFVHQSSSRSSHFHISFFLQHTYPPSRRQVVDLHLSSSFQVYVMIDRLLSARPNGDEVEEAHRPSLPGAIHARVALLLLPGREIVAHVEHSSARREVQSHRAGALRRADGDGASRGRLRVKQPQRVLAFNPLAQSEDARTAGGEI